MVHKEPSLGFEFFDGEFPEVRAARNLATIEQLAPYANPTEDADTLQIELDNKDGTFRTYILRHTPDGINYRLIVRRDDTADAHEAKNNIFLYKDAEVSAEGRESPYKITHIRDKRAPHLDSNLAMLAFVTDTDIMVEELMRREQAVLIDNSGTGYDYGEA